MPLIRKDHDLATVPTPKQGLTDLRVPTPEGLALGYEIPASLYRQSRLGSEGWSVQPTLAITPPRSIAINGSVTSSTYPGDFNVDTQVVIPSLSSTTASIKQTQHLQLVIFAAECGVPHDPDLSVTFSGQQVNNLGVPTGVVQAVTKENDRRIRAFWLLVLSPDRLTPSDFNNLVPAPGLTIVSTANTGFALNNLHIYGVDSNLVPSVAYPLYREMTEVIPLAQLRRLQNSTEQGYTWGANGEEDLSRLYHLAIVAPRSRATAGSGFRTRLIDIMTGKPSLGSAYQRTVRNLTAASVSIRPERPGVASDSPNGSICLSNSQRVSFSNEAIVERYGAQTLTAANDGSGNALLAAIAFTAGASFSENAADHKIFSAAGVDETANGRFLNLGGVGSLTWIAGANSSIVPGLTAYFVPAIKYPAGSGFSVPFEAIERAWNGATEISPANILLPQDDLSGYINPSNGESFFVVTGAERAAIHYVLRRVAVTSNSQGVATIPNNTFGNLAFIEGVSGRIDAPARTGLAPNTTYNALQYYAPRTIEQWQFQMRVCEYQGLGNTSSSWLNGAEITSNPIMYLHTHGGAASVYRGDATFRFIPIAMHLPMGNSQVFPYSFNHPVQLANTPYSVSDSIRELPPLPAAGLALPTQGQQIEFTANSSIAPRSNLGKVAVNGQTLGFKFPALEGGRACQAVLAFTVRKGTENRLLIATFNGVGGTDIQIDSATGTGFDTFRI
jgi:hypothetical protein